MYHFVYIVKPFWRYIEQSHNKWYVDNIYIILGVYFVRLIGVDSSCDSSSNRLIVPVVQDWGLVWQNTGNTVNWY